MAQSKQFKLIRIEQDLYELCVKNAEAEGRSATNYLNRFLRAHLELSPKLERIVEVE